MTRWNRPSPRPSPSGRGENRITRTAAALFVALTLLPLEPVGQGRAAPAGPPDLTAPGDGERLTTVGPALVWANPQGTTQVHLQVVPANNDGPGVDIILGSPATAFQIPAPPNWYGLLPGMTYAWRVRACDAPTGVSAADPCWGPWAERRFKTPEAFSGSIGPLEPPAGATVTNLTPRVRWSSAVSEVFYYEFQLSKDPEFVTDPAAAWAMVYSALLHGGVTDPANSYQVPGEFPLEAGTAYYWRVRPRIQGDGVPATWTAPFSFSTVPSEGADAEVVDQPAGPRQFTGLAEALNAVCSAPPAARTAWVNVSTGRALPGGSLAAQCDVKIEATTGQGAITGGLTVDAPGAFTLVNFRVDGPVFINANRRLDLLRGAFGGDVTVNYGGLAGAPFPAGQAGTRVTSAGQSVGFSAMGSEVAESEGRVLRLNWAADVRANADFGVRGSRFQEVYLDTSGHAFAAGSLRYERTVSPRASFTLDVNGSLKADMANSTIADRFTGNYRLLSGDFSVESRLSTVGAASLSGVGDGYLDMLLKGDVYNHYEGAFDTRGVRTQANDVRFEGEASLRYRRGALFAEVGVNGGYVNERLSVAGTASVGGTIQGAGSDKLEPVRLTAAPAPGPIVVENVHFRPGAPSLQPALFISDVSGPAVTGVQVRNNRVETDSGFGITLSGVDVPVTVQDNVLTRGGIYLYSHADEGGQVTASPTTPYVVQGNTVSPTVLTSSAFFASGLANVQATGNRFMGPGFVMAPGAPAPDRLAVGLAWGAYVRFTGNNINGMVSLGRGSFARFEGNTFTDAFVSEDAASPALVIDPVKNNSGLDPLRGIVTLVDWDRNGCRDYPPEINQLPREACTMPGIAGVPPPVPPT